MQPSTWPGAAQQYSQQLPTEGCMPYKPDLQDDMDRSERCGRCGAPNKYASQGGFASFQITSIWEAQRYIRQYGSVVTRFDILDDFRPFFSTYANAQAIYRPKPSAKYVEGHAVVLVGYNNEHQFWIAKNSWGPDWADNGFFKVAFGACSILTENGEAYGISWAPKLAAMMLDLMPGPKPGCYWYKARSGDYMSRVAWLAGIRLGQFMMDNVDSVKDLDAPLEGINLLVCDRKEGRPVAPQPMPSSSATSDPQLEALLRIKSAIDKANHLTDWSRESGAKSGYCWWFGVGCDNNLIVRQLRLFFRTIGVGLQGTLPPASAFVGLEKLMMVIISHQPDINGTIPSDWSQMRLLQFIGLMNNSLTGTLPATWASFSKLTDLHVAGNKLTGQIPDAYKALTALEWLSAQRNQLRGTVPAWLGNLSRLTGLQLSANMLSGRLPNSLKALSVLERLELAKNLLTGSIPAGLGELRKLNGLNLLENWLTGRLPDSLRGLTALQYMELSNNLITGTIPAFLGSLHNLTYLHLGLNNFNGTLPDSYKALTALNTIGVEVNALVGTVPASWGSMTQLQHAWFGANVALGGCMPKTWSGKLKELDIGSTKITGFC